MRAKQNFLTFTLLTFLLILTACGDSSDESTSNDVSEQESSEQTDENEAEESEIEEEAEDEEPVESSNEGNQSEDEAEAVTVEPDSNSKKEDYISKLADLEKTIEADPIDGTTREMEEKVEEHFTMWDDALNEIYGVLEEQLSGDKMEQLRIEQREWIENRDESAQEEATKVEGGSIESLTYFSTQAKETKKRSFELIENYM